MHEAHVPYIMFMAIDKGMYRVCVVYLRVYILTSEVQFVYTYPTIFTGSIAQIFYYHISKLIRLHIFYNNYDIASPCMYVCV